MKKNISTSVCLLLILPFFMSAQTHISSYAGDWEGALPRGEMFSFDLSLQAHTQDQFLFRINLGETRIEKHIELEADHKLQVDLGEGVVFSGKFNEEHSAVDGFMRSGVLLYHLTLIKNNAGIYQGKWNLFLVEQMQPATAFLAFEVDEGGNYAAYTLFGDARFAGTWAGNFQRDQEKLSFQDFRTGLRFSGILGKDQIELEYFLAGSSIGKVPYARSSEAWALGTTANDQQSFQEKAGTFVDGWKTQSLEAAGIEEEPLQRLEQDIFSNDLTFTHGIAIAHKGKLVYDRYFFGNDQEVPHDQRSAAKSYASALIGIAIDEGFLDNTSQKLYSRIPKDYQYSGDKQKAQISIEDLLTMSSGLDAIDFGLNRNSAASEDAYQSSPDWLKTVLEAPMLYEPGMHANYGSANPYLLGVMLQEALPKTLEEYADEKLFKPLGIHNYIIQGDLKGIPYFGGGWFLTPRDMLKFGQLYLNQGVWQGKRILSEKWVKRSFDKYGVLENTSDKNEYGYLWWHKTYKIGDQEIPSIEARGSGGQYIMVLPSLELVVAITSGNYRNGRFAQPEQILETYILPAVLGKK